MDHCCNKYCIWDHQLLKGVQITSNAANVGSDVDRMNQGKHLLHVVFG